MSHCELCGKPLVNHSQHVGGRGYVSYRVCPDWLTDLSDDGRHTCREAHMPEDYDYECKLEVEG